MEEDNNKHPSLPSNYVTLTQLQQRWLKQKEKERQLQEKHGQQQQQQQLQQEEKQVPKLRQHNPRESRRARRPSTQQQAWRVIQTHRTGFESAAGKCPPAESGPKNPKISESNRVAIEVSGEKNESLEAKADIGDGNAGQHGKKKKPKKKCKRGNRKPRADEEKEKLAEDALQSTVEGNKEGAHSDVQKVDDKTETKIEWDVSKSNNLMVEVEQKLGTLSMDSRDDQQNRRLRSYNSFRGSQRNYGGLNYRIAPSGGRFRAQEAQRRRVDQQIWVRKNEILMAMSIERRYPVAHKMKCCCGSDTGESLQ